MKTLWSYKQIKISFGFYVLNLVTLNDYKNNIDLSLYFKTLYPA